MKISNIVLGFALVFLTFGCNKDNNVTENNDISVEEIQVNAKIDMASDDVSDLVLEQETNTYANSTSGKSTESAAAFLPSCATITRVPSFGTPLTPGTLVTKTIDFGTVGCPLPNGNILKGKIIMTFTFQPSASVHTITYTFENFYHNAIKYDGTKTFTRSMTGTPSHPIVTMNMDMNVTFPNGNVYTRIGTRTREIVEGYSTPMVLLDNIYRVTGNWSTSFQNTTVQTSTITTPLYVKMSCITVNKPLIVGGVITIVRNVNTAVLNYGNGDCDNIATLSINGGTPVEITIGN